MTAKPVTLPAICTASILSVVLASVGHADVSAAARAFADGQSAQLEGDYDRAAQSFELAYGNAPSKEALRSAIRARQLAGQLARAATLSEILLVQYAGDPTSTRLASDVIAEARLKLSRVTVACATRCAVAIDGRALSLPPAQTHVVYVPSGRHALEVTFDDARSATRDIAAVTGADTQVQIQPPATLATPATAMPVAATVEAGPAREPAPRAPRGLPPAVALTGGAVAVGLAGLGMWSGLDTRHAHDAYVANPTHDAFVQGQSKQLRTNILVGSAVGVGLASAVVAIWWTRWGSREAPAISLAPSQGGGLVTFGASF